MQMQTESVASRLQAVLNASSYIRSYRLAVLETSDELIIRGRVNSFYHKQMAQEEAINFTKDLATEGVTLVIKNEIVVNGRK